MSLEGTNTNTLLRSVDQLELPNTTQGILSVLRRVLSKPYVQSVELRTGSPITVTWYKDASDSLSIGEPEVDPDTILASVKLAEFVGGGSPKESLVDAMLLLTSEGHFPAFFFVGSVQEFKNWLSIPRVVPLPKVEDSAYLNFIGVRLLEVPSLPDDCFVLLGADVVGGSMAEVSRALKIVT